MLDNVHVSMLVCMIMMLTFIWNDSTQLAMHPHICKEE